MNVAAANPAIVAKLEAIMAKEHTVSTDFPIKGLGDPVPPKADKKK
jgi:hypothetical protein